MVDYVSDARLAFVNGGSVPDVRGPVREVFNKYIPDGEVGRGGGGLISNLIHLKPFIFIMKCSKKK